MLATFCPVISDPVWRASAAKHVGDPLPLPPPPPFPPLPEVVVGVSVAPAAASVVVAATSVAAGVSVAATSVAAAASVVAPFPPRPRLPPPTLPESASVFVVAIERTSAADDSIAGGAEGAWSGGDEGAAAAGSEDCDSHCRFRPWRGSR